MVLRYGDSGQGVHDVSSELVEMGLLAQATYKFDRHMEMAVLAWQHHGMDASGEALEPDGIVGRNTLFSLRASDSEQVFAEIPRKFSDMTLANGPFHNEVVNIALEEIRAGAREIGGNNQGKFVDKYHRTARASDYAWAWCAAFTSWCFEQASIKFDVDMPFDYTGGAQDIFHQMRRKKWNFDPQVVRPEAGDVVVWWRGQTKSWQGHVGIVWGCVNDIVYVIEGNVGRYPAQVRILSYHIDSMSKLIGFARVPASYFTQ